MAPQLSQDIASRRFSREEYRRWYAEQPKGRYERVDGFIVQMAAERSVHARVKGAAYRVFWNAVKQSGVSCEVFPDGMTVEVAESDYEPDVLVNCGDKLADDAISAPNPVIVVEVLSPSTASADMGVKFIDYFRARSVSHYLIVHPLRRVVIHHRRDGASVKSTIVAAGPITLDPPGITIMVEDMFETE